MAKVQLKGTISQLQVFQRLPYEDRQAIQEIFRRLEIRLQANTSGYMPLPPGVLKGGSDG